MKEPLRVVHYINQFFAGIGGEEKADSAVQVEKAAVGPGRPLQQQLGEGGVIVATIICGDNYINDERAAALESIRGLLEDLKPDLMIAGPAFRSGRYGLGCAHVCKTAQELGIPALAGMHEENPGVLQLGREVVIVPTGTGPVEMSDALRRMARLGLKLGTGTELGPAVEEGYISRGIRKIVLRDEPGYRRAVDMLAAKLRGETFRTEIPMNPPEQVEPAPPVRDLSSAVIALVTTGGLIRKGNPDRQTPSNALRYHSHSVEDLASLTPDLWEAHHSGYFTHYVNQNPNYVLPLSYLRELERGEVIGGVHPTIYALPGVMTPVARSKELGAGIARELAAAGVDGCILVAT
jgi:glycine reductase